MSHSEKEIFCIRFAVKKDIPIIFQFIKDLAEYEKMTDEVVATEEMLQQWLFEKEKAEVFIGEMDGKPVGFALFFYNFSTFLGRSGIYLEDLYIRPEARGMGLGKEMIRHLAELALSRGCGRLEWSCLDWNSPSISFYLSLGAKPMKDWTVYRLEGTKLSAAAQSNFVFL